MFDELPSSNQAPCLLRIIAATEAAVKLTPDMRASLATRAVTASEHVLAKGGSVCALLACARMLARMRPPASAPIKPQAALQRALRAADAAPGAQAPALFCDCLEAALDLSMPPAFCGELAVLCAEYVAWAARMGVGAARAAGAAQATRFAGLRERVVAVTGKPVSEPAGASAGAGAAGASAAAGAAGEAAEAAPPTGQPTFAASSGAPTTEEDL